MGVREAILVVEWESVRSTCDNFCVGCLEIGVLGGRVVGVPVHYDVYLYLSALIISCIFFGLEEKLTQCWIMIGRIAGEVACPRGGGAIFDREC